jgi:hypothetical protein
MENTLIIHQEIKKKLHDFYESNRIPHIIFYGPSGCGKQTLIREFLQKVYRNIENVVKNNVMYVNCAHGKGIKFIREDLKFFAKTNVQFNGGYSFKSVILLNADNLTIDAQSALRRCIEQFSQNTRFFIIVENKQRLLHPIISRFCNIYVPFPIIKGKPTNLHQYFISQRCNQDQIQLIQELIGSLITKKKYTHKELIGICETMYDNAICCHDLVQYICNCKFWTSKEKSILSMCFLKIRLEFRCEKMLMLYLLDFVMYRINDPLHEITFL